MPFIGGSDPGVHDAALFGFISVVKDLPIGTTISEDKVVGEWYRNMAASQSDQQKRYPDRGPRTMVGALSRKFE